MNIDPAALEEMRLRLTTMIQPSHKPYPTHYANPDGPDAWAMIEHLVRELELARGAA